jgi:UDPglucose--hexose-1-phosphate uridylyltransferase
VSELRWNPLLGEWVVTATHRQDRTFLPPPDFCPLCPTRDGGFETEIPAPDYEIVVFENLFPSLRAEPPEPAVEGSELYPVRPAQGVCEVVVYTSEHDSTLARQDLSRIEDLVEVWADRFRSLGELPFVDYVYIFENKGLAIGVTLHHPHGQIYAYPFVPPVIQRELGRCLDHRGRTGRCLLCDVVDRERSEAVRVVLENDSFLAYVPFFARWPYEVHLSARRHCQAITDLDAGERADLADALKRLLGGFDALFSAPFPYVMAFHQRPTDGGDYGHYHFHLEFYPPLRTAEKLKYLAGSELGAGVFVSDTLAEERAAVLRERCQAAVEEVAR